MNLQSTFATQILHIVSRVAEARSKFSRNYQGLLASLGFAALVCIPSIAWAAVAPPLGVAQGFGALGNSAVSGSTGSGTVINGDVGSSPTASITNFPPSSTVPPFIVHNTGIQPDGVVNQAHADAIAAFLALNQGPGTALPNNLSTVGALTPGIYSVGAPDLPSGTTLTLNGSGVFVFNVSSTLTANVLSSVTGTANPCNIYWQIGQSATLNGNNFWGTVIADASITLGAGANLQGRALAGTGATGAVTMAGSGGNSIGGCSVPVVVPPAGGVELAKSFFPSTVLGGGVSTLTITLFSNNLTPVTLTSPLTDTLPIGVVIAPIPNASTTCGIGGLGGGVVTASPGGNTVSLSTNSTIPGGAPGACTITVDVIAPLAGGSFLNTLGVCTLHINAVTGAPVCNTLPASATLISIANGPPGGIPTMSELALILLAAILVLFGAAAIRRRTM
jgi:Ice-binding-like